MTLPEMQALADRMDTGIDNPDTSRALVAFNLTPFPLGGIAVFHASMSWSANLPLPPVSVATLDGGAVPAAIGELADAPDLKGRADRRHLTFALHFAVSDIPARGWRTYIVAYADVPSPELENRAETADLIVVETTRHGGELPPTGTF